MLTLILADAELELVPQKLTGHQQVIQSARRSGVNPSRMLLDSSQHYAGLRGITEGERRGRPDLVHFFLLTVLESIPNKRGDVRVLVHTRNDELLRFAPETRLIRNYNRFCGLIQKLFETGSVGDPEPLIEMQADRDLNSILRQIKPKRTIVLHPQGTPKEPRQVFLPEDATRDVVAIIGGFPSGDFRSGLPKDADRISIFTEPLTVWTVASELLAHYPDEATPSTR